MVVLIVAVDLLAKPVFLLTTKMGSNSSKPNNEAAASLQKNNDVVDANSDPRSPTPEIARTPLQVLSNYTLIRTVCLSYLKWNVILF